MDNWEEQIKEVIHSKLEGIKDRDLRFFRIEEFIRNVVRTGKFSNNCPVCNSNKTEINAIIEKIDEAVKVPGRSRREYSRFISRLSGHLTKKHHFYPPYHFTYLFSFIGLSAGLITGFLGSMLFPSTGWTILIVGFIAGLLAGQVLGNRKDHIIRTEGMLM